VIGRLEGRLHHVRPGTVIIDAGGVGYRVSTTLRAFQKLTGVDGAALWIHTQLRDDAIALYGFLDMEELEVFEKLIAVAGVGPRTALAVLSAMAPGELAEAVDGAQVQRLQRTPGVGRKTAERIVLELRGRLEHPAPPGGDQRGDVVSALVNLGYSERAAAAAVDGILRDVAPADLAEALRLALQRLSR
jgi:Holliday junction DNA helicase RuvA